MSKDDSFDNSTVDPLGSVAAPVFNSPFCGELRSKNYFLLDVLPTSAEQYLDPSGHCWCFMTHQVVGPDGGKVHPNRCTSDRRCYKSALA